MTYFDHSVDDWYAQTFEMELLECENSAQTYQDVVDQCKQAAENYKTVLTELLTRHLTLTEADIDCAVGEGKKHKEGIEHERAPQVAKAEDSIEVRIEPGVEQDA